MQDTDIRAAAAYHALLTAMPAAERLEQAVRLSTATRELARAGLGHRHPSADAAELRWREAALVYGPAFARRVLGPGPGAPR